MNDQSRASGDEASWPYDPEARATYMEVVRRPPGRPTPFRELTISMIGRIWGRDTLSMRDRRIIVITITAMSGTLRELEVHVRAALDAGDLGDDDLEELSIQLAMYGGWPRASQLQSVLASVRRSPGLVPPSE